MQGDVTPLTTAGSDAARARKGPRHAAPRTSLLSKLQKPAGKAMALAAMPTAVFMGMSLTPKLALADDKDIPFAPGPCVTRSDEPAETEPASPEPTQSAKPSDEPSRSPGETPGDGADAGDGEGGAGEDGGDEAKPGEMPSAAEAGPTGAGAGAGKTDGERAGEGAAEGEKPVEGVAGNEPAPEATPGAVRTRNPLDPLGLGEAIKDLFDGPGTPGEEETATPAPTPSGTASPAKPPEKPAATPSPSRPAQRPTGGTDGTGDGTSDRAAERAKAALRDAADKAGAEVEELDEDAKGLEPRKDEDIPEGAKPRFPCPTADPEALAAAELEPGIPLLPDDPWILKSSKLTLRGLDYQGIVEVRTGSGKIKRVLKFTATSIDIDNLHQLVKGPMDRTGHVEARKGSTSTIRHGTVTMYTEKLQGDLFSAIPVTFSPDTPPPLNVPLAVFTDVTVTQAGQFGGTLKIPGLRNYFTGGAAR
ncbi:hypothetical protein ACFYT4_19270 [Streptomyces sp. NPDC004609]|uniref:hypothetical protein n=1 Tax=Streptomyces sp. NPDC004609 TaxID=3364704 RepID=UPI0036D0ADEA